LNNSIEFIKSESFRLYNENKRLAERIDKFVQDTEAAKNVVKELRKDKKDIEERSVI
jgi:hypothetical protein